MERKMLVASLWSEDATALTSHLQPQPCHTAKSQVSLAPLSAVPQSPLTHSLTEHPPPLQHTPYANFILCKVVIISVTHCSSLDRDVLSPGLAKP